MAEGILGRQARNGAMARQETSLEIHTFTGSVRKVTERYHRDIDRMGWLGYVEVTHTLANRRRDWKSLFMRPRTEMVVTYRRLD